MITASPSSQLKPASPLKLGAVASQPDYLKTARERVHKYQRLRAGGSNVAPGPLGRWTGSFQIVSWRQLTN